ncbi:MAG: C39 family peptidase [Opitutales bacterium]
MLLSVTPLPARYAPLVQPETLRLEQLTPVFDPDDPEKQLGEFRPGIDVRIVERRGDHWLAAFERPGAADIPVLIEVPDLAQQDPARFAELEETLKTFPVLNAMLTAPEPWPKDARAFAAAFFGSPAERRQVQAFELKRGDAGDYVVVMPEERPEGVDFIRLYHRTARLLEVDEPERAVYSANAQADAKVFGIEPMQAFVDYAAADRPALVIEIWNKTDGYGRGDEVRAFHEALRETLKDLQDYFYPEGMFERDPESVGITALNHNRERFYLANDVVADVRFELGEYLILELQSYAATQRGLDQHLDAESIQARIQASVTTHPEGFVYLAGIPMIDQGEKGYCAAATVARTLQHYGYTVDMHSLAKLAKTSHHGTYGEDLVDSMQRICNSTQFRLRELREGRRLPDTMQATIESGQPIVWHIPGHLRLIIGIHPESRELIYSDTWGRGHEYKVIAWHEAQTITRGLWVLDLPE